MILLAFAMLVSSSAAQGPVVVAEDPIVCKADKSADLGSNIRKRKKTCMRSSEWKQLEILNEQARRELFDSPRSSGSPNGGGAGVGQ